MAKYCSFIVYALASLVMVLITDYWEKMFSCKTERITMKGLVILKLYLFIYLWHVQICVCAGESTCHDIGVEVISQLVETYSLPPLCVSWGTSLAADNTEG